jgi:hypothetical protein
MVNPLAYVLDIWLYRIRAMPAGYRVGDRPHHRLVREEMIYCKSTPGNGKWHCPFPRWWVDMMKRAAKRCEGVTEEQVEAALSRECVYYKVPPGDFLSEPQDARGLPLSLCEEEQRRQRKHPHCRASIYDYSTVPDVVVTNGEDDWPLRASGKVLLA